MPYCHASFEKEMKETKMNQRRENFYGKFTQILLDLMNLRFKTLDKHLMSLYNLKLRFFDKAPTDMNSI